MNLQPPSAERPGWRNQDQSVGSVEVLQQFVARQPILDRSRRTFGYELLFRAGWENRFSGDGEAASRRLIDDALTFGFESVVGDSAPFVNCTRTILLDGLADLLPRSTVIEVLEDEVVDDALIAACKRLQLKGYRIALDDFDFCERWAPMLPLADFIKLDFRNSLPAQRKALIQKLSRSGTQFLAEKVESEDEFRLAREEGFHLFQGYFFAKPVVLGRLALNSIMDRLRLWSELRKGDLDPARILPLIKQEVALSLRLLRFANSALVSARNEVTSLRTALAIMGTDRFRKMAIIFLTSEVCGSQPAEVYRSALRRARFCELMSQHTANTATELYIFGMLAVLKTVLGLTHDEVQQLIKLPADLMQALSGETNDSFLLLQAASHFDDGRWSEFDACAADLSLKPGVVARYCNASRVWADDIVASALDIVSPSNA
jgi:EAL and modified HD-GYP domain-containing signal transduction protein